VDEHNGNESVSISIIKFVSDQVSGHSKVTEIELAALKELIFARFNSEKEAANLAYLELQRRLDVLNHNHEEMNKRNAFFMPREYFDQFFRDFGAWRDQVNGTLSNQAGRMAAYAIVIVIVFGLLGVVLHFWK